MPTGPGTAAGPGRRATPFARGESPPSFSSIRGACWRSPDTIPSRAPGEWEKFYRNEASWRLWQWATSYYDHHRNRLSSYEKNLLMADSDDGGITWKNPRAVTHLLDEMHGSAVQLPDGRIVLMYVHRLPALHGGERAKVSRDGGYTWEEELYYLNTVGAPNWEEVLTALKNADGGVFTFEESRRRSFPAEGQTLEGHVVHQRPCEQTRVLRQLCSARPSWPTENRA